MADDKKSGEEMRNSHGLSPVASLQQFYDELDLMSPEEYAAKEKKLVQKIDFRLMPLLFLMIVMK
jgi:hypothetical protein